MTPKPIYVAVIYQGMVLNAEAVGLGDTRGTVQTAADEALAAKNAQAGGESEGYNKIVLPIVSVV